jgi:hypothetical protein
MAAGRCFGLGELRSIFLSLYRSNKVLVHKFYYEKKLYTLAFKGWGHLVLVFERKAITV